MKCFRCGRSPFTHSIALTRQNPPGELPAVWACSVHDKTPIDPLMDEVVQALQDADEMPRGLSNDPNVTRACEEEIAARGVKGLDDAQQ